MSKPWISVTSIAILAIVAPAVAPAEKKVAICHLPPGNPANAQTLTVSEAALSAHLRHGDQLGACATSCSANPGLCDDGNACTSDSCGADGTCRHDAVGCDDGNPCSTDLCDPGSGCLAVANDGASCDDGNNCTGADVCAGTACRGTAIAGCCLHTADCDDLNPCTLDECSSGRCLVEPKTCSVADKCVAGFCNADGDCDAAPVSCDDSNVCTDDLCDSVVGCSHLPTTHPPEATEASCADGADNDCDGFIDAEDTDCFPPDPGGDG